MDSRAVRRLLEQVISKCDETEQSLGRCLHTGMMRFCVILIDYFRLRPQAQAAARFYNCNSTSSRVPGTRRQRQLNN